MQKGKSNVQNKKNGQMCYRYLSERQWSGGSPERLNPTPSHFKPMLCTLCLPWYEPPAFMGRFMCMCVCRQLEWEWVQRMLSLVEVEDQSSKAAWVSTTLTWMMMTYVLLVFCRPNTANKIKQVLQLTVVLFYCSACTRNWVRHLPIIFAARLRDATDHTPAGEASWLAATIVSHENMLMFDLATPEGCRAELAGITYCVVDGGWGEWIINRHWWGWQWRCSRHERGWHAAWSGQTPSAAAVQTYTRPTSAARHSHRRRRWGLLKDSSYRLTSS